MIKDILLRKNNGKSLKKVKLLLIILQKNYIIYKGVEKY